MGRRGDDDVRFRTAAAPQGVVVLPGCFLGARDAALQSMMVEMLSCSGITTVGMWVEVKDRAAIVYDGCALHGRRLHVWEFIRALAAGASVACDAAAPAQVALDVPAAAGAAFPVPGLTNGYGLIREEPAELRLRVEGIEAKPDRVLAGES